MLTVKNFVIYMTQYQYVFSKSIRYIHRFTFDSCKKRNEVDLRSNATWGRDTNLKIVYIVNCVKFINVIL